MDVLVTGGTGFLGHHLAAAPLERGVRVFLPGRNFAPVEQLVRNGAIPVVADLRDAAAVQTACKGMNMVFHAGALSFLRGRRADFFATNVGGTEAGLAGCQAHTSPPSAPPFRSASSTPSRTTTANPRKWKSRKASSRPRPVSNAAVYNG